LLRGGVVQRTIQRQSRSRFSIAKDSGKSANLLRLFEECLDWLNFAGGEVVDGSGCFEFAGLDGGSDDWLKGAETFDSAADVGPDSVFKRVAGQVFALNDGGLDRVDEVVDGSGERVLVVEVLDGGFDGSALRVAEDEDGGHTEFGNGVLDGTFDGGSCSGDVVAGDANDEEIADAEVEEDFGGDSGVGASDDAGDRSLAARKWLEVGRCAARMGDVSGSEAGVALV
jgi:hypothetical protein